MKNFNVKILAILLLIFNLNAQTMQDKWITILIHGTVGLKANICFENIIRLLKDDIDCSQYEKNVASIRENPFLFTMQAMQRLGLKPVVPNCSSPCGPYAFATIYNQIYDHFYNCKSNNCYYTFGWSGLLSYNRRYTEGRILYNQLKQEIIRLRNKNQKPKIRIIAYSHAANLALNLAALRMVEFSQDNFCIDELILLGMPVQRATSGLIYHPMFKKIYHIYSKGDNVQRLDFFSPCNIISHRTFRARCLPDKLTQIQLKVTAPLTRIPGKVIPQGMRGIIDQSPGHTELWFFGWVPSNYRKNSILYPLPAAMLIPFITNTVEKYRWPSKHMIVDIHPEKELAFICDKDNGFKVTIPFMSTQQFSNFKYQGVKFHPGQPQYQLLYARLESNIDPYAYV